MPQKNKIKFNIVIPCYNEEKTIANTIEDFLTMNPNQVIVVDDCSTDTSYTILKKYPITILQNQKNSGVGYSLNKGLKYSAKQNNSEYTITADADGQHKSTDIKKIIETAENQNNYPDIIYAIRKLRLRTTPITKLLTNFIVQITMFCIYGSTIKDPYCGLRAYKNEFIEKLNFRNGFDWPIDLIIKLKDKKTTSKAVYIEARYTKYSLQKGQNIRSGAILLKQITRNRLIELTNIYYSKIIKMKLWQQKL